MCPQFTTSISQKTKFLTLSNQRLPWNPTLNWDFNFSNVNNELRISNYVCIPNIMKFCALQLPTCRKNNSISRTLGETVDLLNSTFVKNLMKEKVFFWPKEHVNAVWRFNDWPSCMIKWKNMVNNSFARNSPYASCTAQARCSGFNPLACSSAHTSFRLIAQACSMVS